MSGLPGLVSGYGSGSSSDESDKEEAEDPSRDAEKTLHLKVRFLEHNIVSDNFLLVLF